MPRCHSGLRPALILFAIALVLAPRIAVADSVSHFVIDGPGTSQTALSGDSLSAFSYALSVWDAWLPANDTQVIHLYAG